SGALHLAGLDEVEQDLVVGHQHTRRLVHDGRVAQFLVRVPGRQDRHRRLVDGRVSESRVKVAGDERRRRRPADAAATDLGAQDVMAAVIFGDQGAGEVERRAGDGGVDVDPAGKHNQAGRVDGPPALDGLDDASTANADVANDAIDAVGGVVDSAV